MGTQHTIGSFVGNSSHNAHGTAPETTDGNLLTVLREDIASLSREGMTAFHRWYEYRKAVRRLNGYEDSVLREIGIDRGEIDVTAYCIAEMAVSARPDPAHFFSHGDQG
jgi:uncharacterized protein YjiS (DUF1127 family)